MADSNEINHEINKVRSLASKSLYQLVKTKVQDNITITKEIQNALAVEREMRACQPGTVEQSGKVNGREGIKPLEERVKVHQMTLVGRTGVTEQTL